VAVADAKNRMLREIPAPLNNKKKSTVELVSYGFLHIYCGYKNVIKIICFVRNVTTVLGVVNFTCFERVIVRKSVR